MNQFTINYRRDMSAASFYSFVSGSATSTFAAGTPVTVKVNAEDWSQNWWYYGGDAFYVRVSETPYRTSDISFCFSDQSSQVVKNPFIYLLGDYENGTYSKTFSVKYVGKYELNWFGLIWKFDN